MSEGAEPEGADEVLEMQQVVVQLDGQRPKFMEVGVFILPSPPFFPLFPLPPACSG